MTVSFLFSRLGIIIPAVIAVVVVVMFIIFCISCLCCSCCPWYRRRHRGTVYGSEHLSIFSFPKLCFFNDFYDFEKFASLVLTMDRRGDWKKYEDLYAFPIFLSCFSQTPRTPLYGWVYYVRNFDETLVHPLRIILKFSSLGCNVHSLFSKFLN